MRSPSVKTGLTLMIGLGLVLLTSACSSVAVKPDAPPAASSGSFSLFLQPLPQEVHRLTFTIGEMTALRVDGEEVDLPLKQSRFRADQLIGEQERLVNFTLPPGRYRGIGLRIPSADLLGEDGPVDLLPPEDRLVVDHEFTIRDSEPETLFLSLSADRLITDGVFFSPRFSLWERERTLVNLKGFVSSRGGPDLTVFNKRTAQVIGAVRVGSTPADLALDQRRGWLYTALTAENAVAVVEVNTGAILGRVQLRFGDRPTELALTADGNLLVSLNPGSSTVSIIDAQASFEIARVRLGLEANDIFLGPGGSTAYVTHTASGLLSVIDLQSQRVRSTVDLEESPLDGVASADGRSLYLINDFSAELSVLDAASLRERSDIFIGGSAVSILSDEASGLLYVGMKDGGIKVVDPRSAMAIDSYSLPPEPVRALTIDREENALFALLPQSERLLKIDLVGKQVLGRMELGPGGHAVVVMGER